MVHASERDVHTSFCGNKLLRKFLYKNERLFLVQNGNLYGLGSCGFGVIVVGVHGIDVDVDRSGRGGGHIGG
jgi:hypothetical protein